jgi:large subunit ribosomal protein L30
MTDKVKLTLVNSTIGRTKRQGETVKSLGLKKLGSSAIQTTTPDIVGKIKKVAHLIKVEEINE